MINFAFLFNRIDRSQKNKSFRFSGRRYFPPFLVLLIFSGTSFSAFAEYVKDIFGTGSHLAHSDDFETSDEAYQACVDFSQSLGYAAGYCHHANYQPLWEAGWLRDSAGVFHLGAYYHGKCTYPLVFNDSNGECANAKDKGNPDTSCPSTLQLDPINIAVGNSFQTEVDSSSSNLSTLYFARSYNSLDGLWRHNHSTYLRITSFAVALVMADGRESFFTISGNTITPSATELGRLTKTADTWLYTAKNNDTYRFDTTGRLTRWTNASGAGHLLTYANSGATVTNNLGQSLSFTEDAQHQPLTLTAAGLTIQYEYNANLRLNKLTRTRGGQTEMRLFHYEKTNKPNLLTGITDERGVRFTTWTFDDQDRATSSEHAGGISHGDVAYNDDGSSTVTNEFGKKSTYRFVTIDGVKRVSAIEGEALGSCAMSNSTFTYDARGLLKTKTDNKGHLTSYDYNTRGLEVSRTEAAGTSQARVITTEWHPTLFLRTKVTEAARITTYTYDEQGRQLSQSVTQR